MRFIRLYRLCRVSLPALNARDVVTAKMPSSRPQKFVIILKRRLHLCLGSGLVNSDLSTTSSIDLRSVLYMPHNPLVVIMKSCVPRLIFVRL